MLPKYWRLRLKWDGDQTLTYANDARVNVRALPWKLVDGVLTYDTVITDDMGFDAGETIADEGESEGDVQDNTTNGYWGIQGILQVIADQTSTDGTMYLYVESCDDNTTWPSDQADFDITDLECICVLTLSTDAVDEARAKSFVYGEP